MMKIGSIYRLDFMWSQNTKVGCLNNWRYEGLFFFWGIRASYIGWPLILLKNVQKAISYFHFVGCDMTKKY